MENQEQKQPIQTRKERISQLKDAIEIQSLHTELAELRARMFFAQMQEIQSMIQMDKLTAKPEATDQEEARQEFEKVSERKLKQ